MRIIADFHIHSKYSRATSPQMEVRTLARYAEIKGINLLGTGDFTHPLYFKELKEALTPLGNGFFKVKDNPASPVHFILTAEISNIFRAHGKTRRIHTLIFAPSFETVEKINQGLAKYGKLASDGRPIFGAHIKDLMKVILDISTDCMIIPAHAWTPWFSIFGSESGFDTLEECFEELTPFIYAIETGLSSDPPMNRRLSALDPITLISNSDSHSPSRIGREANVLDTEMNYDAVTDVIRTGDPKRFLWTAEFFPEEGKYHYDGHRDCGVVWEPKRSRANNLLCPKCGKRLTIGVMHRVEALADRPEDRKNGPIPYRSMIPLDEIIGEAYGKGVKTKTVTQAYEKMVQTLGPEFEILFDRTEEELRPYTDAGILEGIMKVRRGEVKIVPGYDGTYGVIEIFGTERK